MQQWGSEEKRVVVVGVKMPFLSMVLLLVKLAIACIPATIILALIYAGAIAAFAGLMTALK